MGFKRVRMLENSKETEILKEIRDSEKRSEDILEKASREKANIVDDANKTSAKMLNDKKEEIMQIQEKKVADFREKAGSARKEKLEEGKKSSKQLKAKSEKNIGKAVDFVVKKFEESINAKA